MAKADLRQIGNYRIVARLGKGGMGSVYLGEHPRLGRKVAIKVLSRQLSLDPIIAERFASEARLMASLRHPNVAEVYDFGETASGDLYYVMEYLAGANLRSIIDQHAPFRPKLMWAYISQIGPALQAAHSAGVIHRDLKPENVMAVQENDLHVKVVDFGIAKIVEREQSSDTPTQEGDLVGSPVVMAPEQAAGRVALICPQTDLYALGVMMYWMLCGRPPFQAPEQAVLLYKHIAVQPKPLIQRAPDVDPKLAAVIEKCLVKDPQERPASATALLEELSGVLDLPIPTPVPKTAAEILETTAPATPGPELDPSSLTSGDGFSLASLRGKRAVSATVAAPETEHVSSPAVAPADSGSTSAVPRPSNAPKLVISVAVLALITVAVWFFTSGKQPSDDQQNIARIPAADAGSAAPVKPPDARPASDVAAVSVAADDAQPIGQAAPADLGVDLKRKAARSKVRRIRRIRRPKPKRPKTKRPPKKTPDAKVRKHPVDTEGPIE